jgi:hypothetical protein
LAHAYLMNDELETQNPFIRHIVLKISTIAWVDSKDKTRFCSFKSQGLKWWFWASFKITSELKKMKKSNYLFAFSRFGLYFYWCYFKFPNVYLWGMADLFLVLCLLSFINWLSYLKKPKS